jgi:hypothetical protein
MSDAKKINDQRGAAAARGSRTLVPAAQRALAEAEARRAETEKRGGKAAKELNGRGGLDPVRYGDWEVKGIASDF